MFKILTLNKISQVGLSQLTNNYVVSDDEANPEAILLRSFKMHDMELPDSLLAVARCGAGVNNIPLDKCADKGVVVFNTPGANANAVKELVLTAMLISSRDIMGSYKWAQSLQGQEGIAASVEKGKANFAGPEIKGKTLGIVGLGAIGILVANAAVSLGMKVIGYDPFLSVNNAMCLDPAVKYTTDINDIYALSDYITVHVPATKETTNMINEETLAKCKDGIRIINLARNELVNSDAIKAGIKSGKVSCYVTDFPNEETVGVDNIITLPHLGASTPEAEDNCAEMAAVQMMEYLENGNIVNSVNYPSCSAPRISNTKRVCVLHSASSEVAAAITGASQLVAQVRGNYGYTIADTNTIDVDKIKAVAGVISVRVLD